VAETSAEVLMVPSFAAAPLSASGCPELAFVINGHRI